MCLSLIGYHLDFLKRPLPLRVMSKEKTFTWLGVVVSLMLVVFICLSFFQSDMVQKTSPVVFEKTTIAAFRPQQIFGKNRPFMFGLVDLNSNGYIDDTIFKIDVAIFEHDNGLKNNRVIPSVPCETIDNSLFLNNPLSFSNYLCILDDNIVLQGYFSDNIYKAIFFQLRICNNATDNVTCKSEDEIANFLAGKTLYTIYPDYTYDIDNYDTPYSPKFSIMTLPVSLNNSIWMGEFIKQSTFVNDDFFLYSDPHKTILSMSDTPQTETLPIIQGTLTTFNDLDNPLSVIAFYSSANTHYISRTYQKIQNALANCSGIASALFIIGKILTEIHSRMALLMIIIKNLYVFKTKQKKSKKQEGKARKINKRKKDDQETIKSLTGKVEQKEQYELRLSSKNDEEIFKNLFQKTIIKRKEDIIKESDTIKDNLHQISIPNSTIKNFEVSTNGAENHEKNEFLVGKQEENKIKPKILSDVDNPQPEIEDIIIPMFHSTKGQETKNKANDSIIMKIPILITKDQVSKIKAEDDKIHYFEDYLKKLNEPDNKNYNINISNLMIAKGKRILGKKLAPEEKLILKAEQVFDKEIDIVSILLKLQEIEKIKFVLFTPSQIDLLKLIEKPVIHCEEEDDKNLMMRLSTKIIESGSRVKNNRKKNTLADNYKKMIRSENKSEVDCRILQLLDDEMKLYID